MPVTHNVALSNRIVQARLCLVGTAVKPTKVGAATAFVAAQGVIVLEGAQWVLHIHI